jgi:hypothetical protein
MTNNLARGVDVDESTQTKACSRCREVKPTSEFGINRATTDGLQYHCKVCEREKRAQRTPEQVEAKRRYNAERARVLRADPEAREALLRRTREWLKENPDKMRAARRAWRVKNAAKIAGYREKHREADAARSRAWIKANPEWNRERQHRRRAMVRDSQVGPVDLDALWTGACGICEESLDRELRHPDPMSPTIDHIIALARGGTHTQDNLQWAHRTCNLRKYVNPK